MVKRKELGSSPRCRAHAKQPRFLDAWLNVFPVFLMVYDSGERIPISIKLQVPLLGMSAQTAFREPRWDSICLRDHPKQNTGSVASRSLHPEVYPVCRGIITSSNRCPRRCRRPRRATPRSCCATILTCSQTAAQFLCHREGGQAHAIRRRRNSLRSRL